MLKDCDTSPAAIPAFPRPARPTLRSLLLFGAKLGLTAGLLVLLARRVDWSELLARAAQADGRYLALAVAALAAGTAVAGERWYRLMRHLGVDATRPLAVRATYAGWFVGQFLPGTVGGDAARLWFLWRAGRPLRPVVQSLVLDRVAALLGVLALILASLPHLFTLAAPDMAWAALAAALLASAALAAVLVIEPPLPARWRRGRVLALLDFLGVLRRSLRSRTALFSIVLAAGMQLLCITAVILIAGALGIVVGYGDATGIVATASLLAAVPVSINGWGVREGTIVTGFALIGVPPHEALLVSLLYGLGIMLSVSPGGILWYGRWETTRPPA
jgi:uncharacterized membrane protein YbhN (UPF0104 family)